MLRNLARLWPGCAVLAAAIIATGLLAKVFADTAATQPATPDQIWTELHDVTRFVAAATQPAPPDRGWECINGAANAYYALNRWADVAHSASGFWQAGGNPFQYSPHGYPVGGNINAISQLWMDGCPPGDYHVTWDGNPTLNFAVGGGTWTPTGPNAGTIHLPAEGTVAKNQWGLNPTEQVVLTVTNSPPGNPLDNLHIWEPGYGPGEAKDGKQVYDDRYLNLLKNFAGYRAMNDQAIVGPRYTPTVWAARVTSAMWDRTSFGVAAEDLTALAVEAHLKRLWVCVPYGMDAANAAQMAAFYRANLPPDCQLVVEPGNELWNWGFAFRGQLDKTQAANQAALNGFGAMATGDPNWLDARAAAEWGRAVCRPFRDAFADRPGGVVCVFGAQAGWNLWADAGLGWLKARYGTCQPFTAIGIAPYYGYGLNDATLEAEYADLAKWCADAQTGLVAECNAHTSLADKYGLADGVWDYEGDQHLPTVVLADGTLDPNSVTYRFQLDPRTGNLQDLYLATLHKCRIRVHFSFAFIEGDWDKYGFWPVLRNYEDSTPRWDALQRECLRANPN